MVKESCIMQQTTINFDAARRTEQQSDALALVRGGVQRVNSWLDSRSDFYSRMLGESISWRKALRIGVALPACVVAAAVCVSTSPMSSLVMGGVAGWIVYRLNQDGKGAQR